MSSNKTKRKPEAKGKALELLQVLVAATCAQTLTNNSILAVAMEPFSEKAAAGPIAADIVLPTLMLKTIGWEAVCARWHTR